MFTRQQMGLIRASPVWRGFRIKHWQDHFFGKICGVNIDLPNFHSNEWLRNLGSYRAKLDADSAKIHVHSATVNHLVNPPLGYVHTLVFLGRIRCGFHTVHVTSERKNSMESAYFPRHKPREPTLRVLVGQEPQAGDKQTTYSHRLIRA